jgi:hypothetical protein
VNERIVFTGAADDGAQLLVESFRAEPEVMLVSTRPAPIARWGPPLECTKEDNA